MYTTPTENLGVSEKICQSTSANLDKLRHYGVIQCNLWITPCRSAHRNVVLLIYVGHN